MRDQDKRILIIQKISFQPCDMFLIQIVGRLIKKKDIRFLQKKLGKEYLCSLTTAQIRNITVKSQIKKAQGSGYFLHFCINGIKIMKCQLVLDRAKLFHKCIHLIRICCSEFVTDLIHSLFFFKEWIKS